MKTSFSTAATLKEIPAQARKLVAWTKNETPGRQPDKALGEIKKEDIAGLDVSKEVIPGLEEVFEGIKGGKPVAAPKLMREVVRAVTAEVERVRDKEGDPATLTIGELRQIKPSLRPIALIALAYGDDTGYFDVPFADDGEAFERVADAVNRTKHPVLSAADAEIADVWMAMKNADGLIEISKDLIAKSKEQTAGLKRTIREVKKEVGADYRVTAYLHKETNTFAIYAASTNGPNEEAMVLCRKNGERFCELVFLDDGSLKSIEPDHPRFVVPDNG